VELKVLPEVDSLRFDPRFQALAEKIIPAEQFRAADLFFSR